MSTVADISYFDCLGANIRKKRKELGLSQEQLAEKAFCERQTIINIEKPNLQTIPKFETIINVANALGCSIDNLTGHDAYSTHDIKGVCEFTGLSEKAVEKLHNIYESDKQLNAMIPDNIPSLYDFKENATTNIVSRLIENQRLIYLIKKYHGLLENANTVLEDYYLELEDFEFRKAFGDDYLDKYLDDRTEDRFRSETKDTIDWLFIDAMRKERNIYSDSMQHGLKLLMADEIVNIIDTLITHELRDKHQDELINKLNDKMQ